MIAILRKFATAYGWDYIYIHSKNIPILLIIRNFFNLSILMIIARELLEPVNKQSQDQVKSKPRRPYSQILESRAQIQVQKHLQIATQ